MSRLSRRGILGGAAALVPAVGVGASPSPASPDAELIAVCQAHIDALTAYDTRGSIALDDCDTDPLWRLVKATEDAARSIQATTMAGVAAKARVALHCAGQPDGREDFDTSYTGDRPEQVVRKFLALASG